jgi:hypothetical protein
LGKKAKVAGTTTLLIGEGQLVARALMNCPLTSATAVMIWEGSSGALSSGVTRVQATDWRKNTKNNPMNILRDLVNNICLSNRLSFVSLGFI